MLSRLLRYMQLSKTASFEQLEKKKDIYLYAGDIGTHTKNGPVPFTGLSLGKSDKRHIKHDVRSKIPLADNSVSIYQSEDVFENS